MAYEILYSLSIIIVAAEVCGLIARHFKAPQVVGQILAGLLIGPGILGLVKQTEVISDMAEIGVILLMFSAGLGTNLRELVKVGFKALLIATCGVLVPLIGGFILSGLFHGFGEPGSELFLKNVFIGVIMTATSVSITVQALRDLGRLKGELGTTIMSAAIIDDVIGIIVLTIVISMRDPETQIGMVLLKNAAFFTIAILGGFLCFKLFSWLDKKYEHHRRIPILSIAFCFAMSFAAEEFFGIADITGAYVAGIVLCSIHDAPYVARRMDINSYMIFGPVFFASIGLKTQISGITPELWVFCILFVAVALLTKIIGCGLMAKVFGHTWKESLKVGVGMMTRGEVALIVSQKGLEVGLMDARYFTAVILLIIVSSIATPIILKLLYRNEPEEAILPD
ncbi:MAG: cation:proton antiporter [Lachnospiraceae bacterium]|nr:cation:proton antiporter [Lachnospiraceae bacterium]